MRLPQFYHYPLLAAMIAALTLGASTASAEPNAATRSRIGSILADVADDEMYGEVLEVVLEVMESDYGVFGYIHEDGAFVVPSLTTAIWDECQVPLPRKTFVFPRETWGDSTWPRAIREQRTIVQNETSTLAPEGHIPIRRHISLPVIHRGSVIGLFQVANKRTDYEAADAARLESVAAYIAPTLSARLERDRAVTRRVAAEEQTEVLTKTQQRLLAIAGLALTITLLVCGIVFKFGRAQKTIEQNTAGVQTAHSSISDAETKRKADVATLRQESHDCRTRIHGRLDSMGKDLGAVREGVAEIRGAARMWKQNNGPSGPKEKGEEQST